MWVISVLEVQCIIFNWRWPSWPTSHWMPCHRSTWCMTANSPQPLATDDFNRPMFLCAMSLEPAQVLAIDPSPLLVHVSWIIYHFICVILNTYWVLLITENAFVWLKTAASSNWFLKKNLVHFTNVLIYLLTASQTLCVPTAPCPQHGLQYSTCCCHYVHGKTSIVKLQ